MKHPLIFAKSKTLRAVMEDFAPTQMTIVAGSVIVAILDFMACIVRIHGTGAPTLESIAMAVGYVQILLITIDGSVHVDMMVTMGINVR